MCQTRRLTPQVVRKVVALEGQEAELKVKVDKKSGQDARRKKGSERVYVAVRRPDNGFFSPPLLNSWHGHFSLFWLRLARSSCACVALVVWTRRKRIASCSWASLSPRKKRFERVHQEHLDADKLGKDVQSPSPGRRLRQLRAATDRGPIRLALATPLLPPPGSDSPRQASTLYRFCERRSLFPAGVRTTLLSTVLRSWIAIIAPSCWFLVGTLVTCKEVR